MYSEYDENEDLEEQDDDIGALGSILSWEDEEDGAVMQSAALAAMGNSLRDRDSAMSAGGTSSTPPDMVQFSVKDGVPQFSFLHNGAPMNSGAINGSLVNMNGTFTSVPQHQQQSSPTDANNTVSNNHNGSLTLQLPLPTPVSEIANNDMNLAQQQQQLQQQQQQQQQQNTQGLVNQFTQYLAQQQQALFNQQTGATASSQPAITNPQQPVQFQFTADPNIFLQQLQLLQFQQAAQQVTASVAAAGNTEALRQLQANFSQSMQAQMQQQQAQQQVQQQVQQQQQQQQPPQANGTTPGPVPASLNAVPTSLPSLPAQGTLGPPPKKRQKLTGQAKKVPKPTAREVKNSSTADVLQRNGIVSASDTDGEASRRSASINGLKNNKKSSSAATASVNLAAIMKECDDDGSDVNYSTEERAQANRDRNREHARNTRLRKKAYLEKLKTTVDELCRERDTLVTERTGAASMLVEMHKTRTEVIMSFFALRSTNDKRRQLWSSILDESCFTCVMPVTPYRSFPASEVQVSKCQRTIMGIDGMVADTASLHVLFDSLVDRSKYPDGKIDFRYTLVTEESVVAGNQMMARWVMATTNAEQFGARMDVSKQGMLCCKFNSAHKIIGLELMFDVMAFMLQLKQAAGSDGFSVIPNTVQTCQRSFDKPMIMILADPPYTIVQVNRLWEEMTGYKAEDVVGKVSLSILQRNDQKKELMEGMMQEIRYKRPTSALLSSVNRSGETFRQFVVTFPLSTDSRVTHYVALSSLVSDGALEGQGAKEPDMQSIGSPSCSPLVAQYLPLNGMSQCGQALPMSGMMYGGIQLGPSSQLQLPQIPAIGSPSLQMPPPARPISMNMNVLHQAPSNLKRPSEGDAVI